VGRAKYTGAHESSRRRLLEISRARVCFVHPTIAIAKIRDYSQSNFVLVFSFKVFSCFLFLSFFINSVVLRLCLALGFAVCLFQSLLASSPLYENNKKLNKTRFLSQDPKFI